MLMRYYQGNGTLPCFNVRCHSFPGRAEVLKWFPRTDPVQAERAAEFAYEVAVERFWEAAEEYAKNLFGQDCKVRALGRSNGWLGVDTPELRNSNPDDWSSDTRRKLGVLGDQVRAMLDPTTLADTARKEIAHNCWHETGAEKFNFLKRPDGTTTRLSKMKQAAIELGFGPVVRV